LEVALALSAGLLIRLTEWIAGDGGVVLVLGTVGIVLWRFPVLRREIVGLLRQASIARWFSRALRCCGVVGPLGGHPKICSVEDTVAGFHLKVRMPIGDHSGHVKHVAESLAATLGVREVRVTRAADDASMAHVVVVRRDSLAAANPLPWPWSSAASTSLWSPVPVGLDENGRIVHVRLPEHNLLLGGEPGAGKSAALSLFVATAALDPGCSLTLMDGKQVELAPWARCASRFVGPDIAQAVDVLGQLRREMDTRYEHLLQSGCRKVGRDDEFGLHVVAIDELALYLRSGKKDQRDEFADGLRDLVSRGRAAGMIVLAATQKPSHEIVPTWIRDLFSFRMALRCTSPEASDTVLGQGWATQGYSGATIDPANRGVGFLLHEGGVPVKLRAFYLDDPLVAGLASRAASLRGRS
jgi:hypothetical protein